MGQGQKGKLKEALRRSIQRLGWANVGKRKRNGGEGRNKREASPGSVENLITQKD